MHVFYDRFNALCLHRMHLLVGQPESKLHLLKCFNYLPRAVGQTLASTSTLRNVYKCPYYIVAFILFDDYESLLYTCIIHDINCF